MPANRKVVIGAAAFLTIALLMKMRRGKKGAKGGASQAERFAFPVALTKEVADTLGLQLGDVAYLPPRMSATTVMGMPEDATNPIQTACIVFDALTNASDAEALFAADASSDALLEAIRAYATSTSPYMQGLTAEERDAVKVALVDGVSTTVSLAPAEVPAGLNKKEKAAAAAKALVAPIAVPFAYAVTSKDTTLYIALVPEAKAVVSLIIVNKEGATSANTSAADRSDLADIATVLKTSVVLSRAAVARLAEQSAAAATTLVEKRAPAASTDAAAAAASEGAIVVSTTAKFRAVLPSESTTVEEVRCCGVEGGAEVFMGISGATIAGDLEENYCRVTYYPAMPSTWADEKAITDATEKEDEFKRNVMVHFLGFMSNSITLHPIDISGRSCLWFGESVDGVCCRTYVCPNFSMRGEKSKRKGGDGAKGMTVIRWEGPASSWEQSQKALNSFLDFFQFQ